MITRGTTPTIRYTFSIINVTDIVTAYLTMEQGELVIEKTLPEATIGEDYLEWGLTQEETLALSEEKNVSVQLRYKTNDGNAYATRIVTEKPYKILMDGEI